jgi:hypothetical protein
VQQLVVLAFVLVAARAEANTPEQFDCGGREDTGVCPVPEALHRQVQADLGLSVIQAAYEHPVADHVSASLSAGIFGSYFLPWFDLGDNVIGVGGGARVTWFQRTTGHGLYVAPYVRVHRVSGQHDDMDGTGIGFTAGAFVGWALGLTDKLDLRLGLGAQYIRHSLHDATTSTPFVAIDILVGYRL